MHGPVLQTPRVTMTQWCIQELKRTCNTFSVHLSRSAESATEAISLALHSVSHTLKGYFLGRNTKTWLHRAYFGEWEILVFFLAYLSSNAFDVSHWKTPFCKDAHTERSGKRMFIACIKNYIVMHDVPIRNEYDDGNREKATRYMESWRYCWLV